MLNIDIPPDGTAAEFPLELPRVGDFETVGGVKIYFVFDRSYPNPFRPSVVIGETRHFLSDYAMGPVSLTKTLQFPQSLPAPVQMVLTVNARDTLPVNSTITIYAWSAQTESGQGALNPDEGDNPSILSDTVEVGTVTVISWQEWNRRTGADQGGGS